MVLYYIGIYFGTNSGITVVLVLVCTLVRLSPTCAGSGSHTHEPGASLAKYSWTVGKKEVATKAKFYYELSQPKQKICLKISDDMGKSLQDCWLLKMVKPCALPGRWRTMWRKMSENVGRVQGVACSVIKCWDRSMGLGGQVLAVCGGPCRERVESVQLTRNYFLQQEFWQ